jgi:hypothetical protein
VLGFKVHFKEGFIMNNALELFIANTQAIKNKFIWSSFAEEKKLAAMFYALEGRSVDIKAIKDARAYIRRNTGVFSLFRGNMELCISALLSLKSDREEAFSNTQAVYKKLRAAKFSGSDYLIMAAFQIAANASPHDYDAVIARAGAFYKGMKSRHWFCTSEDDYIFCAALALSDIDVTAGVEQIESHIKKLRGKLSAWVGKNSIQGLAEVLALGCTDDKSGRAIELNKMLKANKLKLNREFILPILGILALLPVSDETIVRELSETKKYLRAHKGFGRFSMMDYEVLLYAAALVVNSHIDEIKSDALIATLSSSVTDIIIAMQVTILCAMMSSAAAYTAAS